MEAAVRQRAALTRAQAQRVQNAARAPGRWIMWFVTTSDPDRPGKAVVWAVVADATGANRVPGELVANTLDQLRAMLPAGLKRSEATELMPPEVIEVWG